MKKRVLFYGDSNTYGYDPYGNNGFRYTTEVRWTNQLQELVKDSWTILADGMNGREIPASGYGMQPMDQTILNCLPLDVFAIMLGSNDILNMAVPDVGRVTSKMDRLIGHVKKLCDVPIGPNAILLLAPPAIDPKGIFGQYAAAAEQLARSYDRLAEKWDILFADAGSLGLEMTSDGVHLSENGHREFAVQMAELLKNLPIN